MNVVSSGEMELFMASLQSQGLKPKSSLCKGCICRRKMRKLEFYEIPKGKDQLTGDGKISSVQGNFHDEKDSRGFELANMVANDAKMIAKVAKLAAKNDANLALPPRFRQAIITRGRRGRSRRGNFQGGGEGEEKGSQEELDDEILY
ncbi:hypothetical protein TNCV_200691 [Trichonephila clavipes]|nr:hypothetical protein TNCV_200691 [Trichonephila clavipes]